MEERRVSRRRFIRLGAALGFGAAGASVVTACCGGSDGSGGSAPAPGTTGAGAIQAGPEVGAGQTMAKESEVKPNSAVAFTETGQPAVLVRLQNGDFVAYSAICALQQCAVANQPRTERLACPCHGGVYNPAKGAAVESGPPPRPLPKLRVEVRNGRSREPSSRVNRSASETRRPRLPTRSGKRPLLF